MIIHVSISTGWTLEYVGENLDLPRLKSLNKYWRKYPPLQVLLAAYVGYKEPEKLTSDDGNVVKEQEEAMAEFFANVPQRSFQPPVMKDGDGSKP